MLTLLRAIPGLAAISLVVGLVLVTTIEEPIAKNNFSWMSAELSGLGDPPGARFEGMSGRVIPTDASVSYQYSTATARSAAGIRSFYESALEERGWQECRTIKSSDGLDVVVIFHKLVYSATLEFSSYDVPREVDIALSWTWPEHRSC